MATDLVIPLSMRSLTPRGVVLRDGHALLAEHELSGAMLVNSSGGTQRLESLHSNIVSVTAIDWVNTFRACTALLNDGRIAVLLLGNPASPVFEVLALPTYTVEHRGLAETGGPFTSMLGRMLSRGAVEGNISIADGDLAWLHPLLNPSSELYFRR